MSERRGFIVTHEEIEAALERQRIEEAERQRRMLVDWHRRYAEGKTTLIPPAIP